jgi:uncharacterized membrane protein
MDDVTLMRALHVLGVVIWIGGVSMMTTTVLPAIRRGDLGGDQARAFEAIERRFVWQARSAVLLVGLSGFYMIWRLDLWGRFRIVEFWWMHAMVFLWLIFAIVLFGVEPFVRRRTDSLSAARSESTFRRLQRAHWLLLALSVLTVLGAVAGSHGWSIL